MKVRRILGAGLLAASLVAFGCGDDAEDEFNPQIFFRLEALGGGACFRLDHIASSGARHEVDAERIFVLEQGERFMFLLANAPPPYEATFDWVDSGCPDSSGQLEARAFEVQGSASEPRILDADEQSVTLALRVDAAAPLADMVERPRVRFEVCSPADGSDFCAGGPTGRTFTGNIGDAFTSHLLAQFDATDVATTPAIVFLEAPRDRVSGIFRGLTDQRLRGEIYINDVLEEVDVSGGDVVLAEDL